MSNASRHSLYFVEETDYGVTPTNPTFKKLRHTGTTLGMAKGTQVSEELSADREIKDFRHGTRQIAGEISVELSHESHDDLIQALLCGTWVDTADQAAVAATGTLTVAAQPTAGDTMTVGAVTYTFRAFADFDAALEIPIGNDLGQTQANIYNALRGLDGENTAHATVLIGTFVANEATLTAVTAGVAGNALATTETFTSASNFFDAATLLGGTDFVAGDSGTKTLQIGTVRRSFSILRHFEDVETAGEPFHLFTGVEINTCTFTATPDGIITMSFAVIGRDAGSATTAPSGSTLGAATTTRVFNSFGGSFEIDGTPFAIATELSLTTENGIEPRYVIGSDKTIKPSIGRSTTTGSLGVWFEDSVFIKKFWNEENLELIFTLVDPDGNQMEITLPNISLTGGQPDVSGQAAIPLTVPFQAVYDPTLSTSLQIKTINAV